MKPLIMIPRNMAPKSPGSPPLNVNKVHKPVAVTTTKKPDREYDPIEEIEYENTPGLQ